MILQIQELSYDTTIDIFYVRLVINRDTRYKVELMNPNYNIDSWEWYFEEYMSSRLIGSIKDKKAKKVADSIFRYGQDLFEDLISQKEIYHEYRKFRDDFGVDKLQIEIDGHSAAFHAIHWEAMLDSELDMPLILLDGVRFYRKNYKPVPYLAKAELSNYLKVLVVTARPSTNDVNNLIIQKPILESAKKSGKNVEVNILNSGTWKGLLKHLKKKGKGYYHIIHFDVHGSVLSYENLKVGHEQNMNHFAREKHSFQANWGVRDIEEYKGEKAWLYLEGNTKDATVLIEAKDLATALRQYRIPVCILNACQSAKQDFKSNDSSLGKVLVESGMFLVLAMRYSILVSAATLFMKTLYTEIFNGKDIEQAIANARIELYHSKNRPLPNGSIDMEDWLLPVVYLNKEVTLPPISHFQWKKWILKIGIVFIIILGLTIFAQNITQKSNKNLTVDTPSNIIVKIRDEKGNAPLTNGKNLSIHSNNDSQLLSINKEGNASLLRVSQKIDSLSIELKGTNYQATYPDSLYLTTDDTILFLVKAKTEKKYKEMPKNYSPVSTKKIKTFHVKSPFEKGNQLIKNKLEKSKMWLETKGENTDFRIELKYSNSPIEIQKGYYHYPEGYLQIEINGILCCCTDSLKIDLEGSKRGNLIHILEERLKKQMTELLNKNTHYVIEKIKECAT